MLRPSLILAGLALSMLGARGMAQQMPALSPAFGDPLVAAVAAHLQAGALPPPQIVDPTRFAGVIAPADPAAPPAAFHAPWAPEIILVHVAMPQFATVSVQGGWRLRGLGAATGPTLPIAWTGARLLALTPPETADAASHPIALMVLAPGTLPQRIETTAPTAIEQAPPAAKLAAAAAGFALLLREDPVMGDWRYNDAALLARAAADEGKDGRGDDLASLIEAAERLSRPPLDDAAPLSIATPAPESEAPPLAISAPVEPSEPAAATVAAPMPAPATEAPRALLAAPPGDQTPPEDR